MFATFVAASSDAAPREREHKVHGSCAVGLLSSSLQDKPSPGGCSTLDSGAGTPESGCLSPYAGLLTPATPPGDGMLLGPAQPGAGAARSGNRLLSCFGAPGGPQVLGDAEPSAITSSEVGIRPSFYWLDAESAEVSAEAREVAEASARWIKSDCQDEAMVVEAFLGAPSQTLAGVFDGHGPNGRLAAKFASAQLPAALAARAPALAGGRRHVLRALREACLEVNAGLNSYEASGFDVALSGTTACLALVQGRRVFVANAGDSRCVLARRGPSGATEAIQLTWDAKPADPSEAKRIQAHGGEVSQLRDESGAGVGAYRVFRRGDGVLPGLAMSRSLGDAYAHAVGVTADPVVAVHALTERDSFLVLASDGLWDVMDNAAVVDFVERYKYRRDHDVSCAEALTLEAQQRWKAQHEEAIVDDVAVVILHVAPLPPPERERSVPRHLARAASSNDEANALHAAWAPGAAGHMSRDAPRSFFGHLYGEGEGGAAAAGRCEPAAAASAAEPGAPGSPATLPAGARGLVPPPSASGEGSCGGSVRSSFDGGGTSEAGSERSLRRDPFGAARLRGAASSVDVSPGLGRPGASLSQPIPMGRGPSLGHGAAAASSSAPGAAADFLSNSMPPIRKAYPSAMTLCSYRSDASASMLGDLHLDDSQDGSSHSRPGYSNNGRVRGGIPRSLSVPSAAVAGAPRRRDSCEWSHGGGRGLSRMGSVDEHALGSWDHLPGSSCLPSSDSPLAGGLLAVAHSCPAAPSVLASPVRTWRVPSRGPTAAQPPS